LLSGGIDSAVTAYIANRECAQLYAITFRYGQVHSKEIGCALQLGFKLGVERHKVFDIPLDSLGGSSLFKKDEIPITEVEGTPSTWVPQRNSVFLAIAFGWAETLGCDEVYIGTNVVDYSGYPDCRPEFIGAMCNALNLASKQYVEEGKEIRIEAPISRMSKAEIIKKGIELGVPFKDTWSCYKGEEKACGLCSSCLIRIKGFKELGMKDPVEYEER